LTLSFSGGVADCIEEEYPDFAFGDFGPILGRAIRRSRLCQRPYRLGSETIRATVIGAGCHSAQLSGSTVYHQNIQFPMKNLPVVTKIASLSRLDGPGVLALAEVKGQGYEAVKTLAEEISAAWPKGPVLIALRQDLAKALGHALALRLGKERPILCIDRVALTAESYLDIATPTGPALPLIVKTLILNR
jgi:ethanolamine utilization protein EutA